MTPEEFLARVRSETNLNLEVPGSTPSPELLDEIHRPGGMTLQAFLNDPRQTPTVHRYRIGHILGPPVTDETLQRWQQRWSEYTLPSDLLSLLKQINGIHLDADLDTGRAYQGLAPMEDWGPARVAMYGEGANAELLDDRYVALSYHQDGSAYVVLDTQTGGYFLMDTAGPDLTSPIGTSAEDLLEWLWENCRTDRS
jgi:hypothetical protein